MDNALSRRAVVAAGLASLQAQSPEPVKVGIIGIGLRSRAHLSALKKLAAGSKITALCDLESERMAKVNQELPAKAEMYTDYRELLRDRNVGAVVIVTPGYLHHEMALAALRAGKDVVLEKPLALNYREALDIIRETRRTGRIVCVGMQRRYTRTDMEVQRIVDSGAIGPVRYINYEEYRNDWNPQSWKYTDPATGQKTSWRFLKKTSGSSELEFSIHSLAMACGLVKSPMARLAASGGVVHYTGRDTRDLSSILVDFASGARLNYSFSCFSPRAGGKLLVIGDTGVIRRDGGKLAVSTAGKPLEPVKFSGDASDDGAEVRHYKEFFENVRNRKPSPLSPEAALEPAKIAYGAEISISENRIVTAKDFPAV
ncbi:MAG: Gfo/Idh/MocA family oxidoreductase [Acidobacteriota bacterium]